MESRLRKIQDKLQANLSSLSALKKIGGGAKFFGTTKRGESVELANDLNSQDKEKQKNAVKRIIANMTLGRDVSQLFADVVKLGQTTNLELKKLVYLYVLNTAKLQPDKALMAVNTFLQDILHQSPIVRALALRTMLCVRVECVTEYTLEPLRRAFSDTDPYVRKTAAIGLGKLFHQNPRLFEEQGFVDNLIDLLADIPIVASNAAIILSEIRVFCTTPITLAPPKVNGNRLLTAMAECTEWGQIYLLELLSAYTPANNEEAATICERVAPRLSSSNPGVVLSAIKVLSGMFAKHSEIDRGPFLNRINAAVLSLTKADHETQYIVLRNITLMSELYPALLTEHVDSFFIRFNDPTYLKVEKLRLVQRLLSDGNAKRVVTELTEYSNEVDVTFVRDVVAAVATACIKCDNVTQQCVALLLNLARRRPEVLPSVITATKNIVRKYPDIVVDLLVPLVEEYGAESIEIEDAKVSFVWMLGEFCDVIENGEALIRGYIDTFLEQEVSVQLSLLTAVVKIFLRNPSRMETTLNHVLEIATSHCTNPDLRDRAWMYWRILSKGIGVEKMKQIIHGRKPPVETERKLSDVMTRGEIARALNTASAVYQRPHRSFLPSYGLGGGIELDEDSDVEEDASPTSSESPSGPPGAVATTAPTDAAPKPSPAHADPLGDLFAPKPTTVTTATVPTTAKPADPFDFTPSPTQQQRTAPPPKNDFDLFGGPAPSAPAPAPKPATAGDDLFGGGAAAPATTSTNQQRSSTGALDDMFGGAPGGGSAAGPSTAAAPTIPQVLDSLQGKGLAIHCMLDVAEEPYHCRLQFHNRGSSPISDFVMQFNKNAFGFVPAASIADMWSAQSLAPGQSHTIAVPIRSRETHFDEERVAVQIGIKTSIGLFPFFVNVSPSSSFLVSAPMAPAEFATHWKALDSSCEVKQQLPNSVVRRVNQGAAQFSELLGKYRFQVVVHRELDKSNAFYGCFKTHTGINCLFEMLVAKDGLSASTVSLKNPRAAELRTLVLGLLENIVSQN